jgi:eukaryotic-like serine/threonine-protein kinase
MPIQSGTHLGPYEILSAIGAGGMGEVYRARDPKLGRDVAIKVLPEAFARDAERMARFQREAKVLASLDHPNIASIYGLEDSEGTRALVMQLVEGPTLADRIKAGPIPINEALPSAKQICDALEYAHERGIVHRDLKPANVKVTNDDAVKVLDFGLAKALEADPASIDISTSPTISRMATQQGVLLGTAAYMSPEQAKAKPVDRRADIWAFGCVLYEMLTGKRAFEGEAVTDTLAAVIKEEPDWSKLPSATPARVRVLLQRCLQKDPKQRLRDIGDARISLDEVLAGTPEVALAGTPRAAASKVRRASPWAAAGVFAIAFAALALIYFQRKPAPAALVQRFEITAPEPSASVVTLSPDGTRLVFASYPNPGRLWLRQMDSLEAHPIGGTEGTLGVPFWSPDGRYIAFFAGKKLKKFDVFSGEVDDLCDLSGEAFVGSWRDGAIIFAQNSAGVMQVSAAGGFPSPLTTNDSSRKETDHDFPSFLPDGRHFIYLRLSGVPENRGAYVGSLDAKPEDQNRRRLLAADDFPVTYVPPSASMSGQLLFVQNARLLAQPFDVGRLEPMGEPTTVADGLSTKGGFGVFSVSENGVLVYRALRSADSQLTIFDRQGRIVGAVGEPGKYGSVAFSPDGKRVVAARTNGQSGNENLWIMDLARGISTRFTFDSADDQYPVWSPDGNRIAFGSNRGGHFDLYQKLSNGGSDEELLFKLDYDVLPVSWSGDSRFLLFGGTALTSDTDITVSVLPLDANGHAAGEPFSFVHAGVGEKFSPDLNGHPLWVAYSSGESGRQEIYVRPFDPNSPRGTPPGGGKWQVSTHGGVSPRWNGNGKELFYVAPDGTVMSVEVGGTSTFQSGVPKPLFKPEGFSTLAYTPFAYWDASSDGQRFIFAVPLSASGAAPPPRFTVVLNWPSLLKK